MTIGMVRVAPMAAWTLGVVEERLTEPFPKRLRCAEQQDADACDLSCLLCLNGKRPRYHAAKQRDELPAPHSITHQAPTWRSKLLRDDRRVVGQRRREHPKKEQHDREVHQELQERKAHDVARLQPEDAEDGYLDSRSVLMNARERPPDPWRYFADAMPKGTLTFLRISF